MSQNRDDHLKAGCMNRDPHPGGSSFKAEVHVSRQQNAKLSAPHGESLLIDEMGSAKISRSLKIFPMTRPNENARIMLALMAYQPIDCVLAGGRRQSNSLGAASSTSS